MSFLVAATVLGASSAGCSMCEPLEARVCEDLGAEDCQLWRDKGRTGIPQGRRPERQCMNSRFLPGEYDIVLRAAKTAVEGYKNAAKIQEENTRAAKARMDAAHKSASES